MAILENTSIQKNEMLRYVSYAIIALLLTVIHMTVLEYISVASVTPDLILILCVWITLVEGRFIGLFAGFAIGLFFDIVSIDVIGTNAFAKIIVVFLAGFFYQEGMADKTIGSLKFLYITVFCSLVHNMAYFFFYLKPSEMSFLMFFFKYGIATTIYTTVFAVFAMLLKIPRKGHRPF